MGFPKLALAFFLKKVSVRISGDTRIEPSTPNFFISRGGPFQSIFATCDTFPGTRFTILLVWAFAEQCRSLTSSFQLSLSWSGAARGLPGCLSYTSSPPRGPTAGVVSRNPEYHIPSFDTIRVTSCSLPVSPGSFSRAILINWKSRKPTAEVPGFKFPARALAGTGNTPRTYSGHEILLCFLLNFLFVCF